MAFRHCLGACVLAAALLQPAHAGGALTLIDAVSRAVADNPELALREQQRQAKAALSREAAQPPPLELGVELENFAGTGGSRGLSGADTTLTLSRVLERGDKALRRQAVADERRALVRTEADIARLELLARVATRFIHVVRDQHLLEVAQEAVDLAEETHRQARNRVDAGAAPNSEAVRAEIDLANAELELEHAEHELKATRISLASLWGERDPRFSRAVGDLEELPALDEIDAVMTKLKRNPQLRRLMEKQRVADARSRLARSKAFADVRVSGGVRRREASDDTAFVAGISIPLGSTERAQPGREAARAEARAGQYAFEAAERELYAVLYGRYQELQHSRTEFDVLRNRIVPATESALSDIRSGYEQGRYSYLELADARRQLITQRRRSIRAAERYHRHLIEIERLTGSAVAAPN